MFSTKTARNAPIAESLVKSWADWTVTNRRAPSSKSKISSLPRSRGSPSWPSRAFADPAQNRPVRSARLAAAPNSPDEIVVEPIFVRLDQSGSRVRKMDRQHESAGAGDLAQ